VYARFDKPVQVQWRDAALLNLRPTLSSMVRDLLSPAMDSDLPISSVRSDTIGGFCPD
jgi:hypothetical protein